MYRIDDTTAASSLPALPTDNVGTPGFFTGGNPASSPPVPPTRVRFWWLNLVQESLMALLTAAGLTPSKSDSTLVLQAIRVLPPGRLLRAPISYGVPGVYTYTPPAGTNFLDIEFVGGGGGGAGSPNSGTLWSGSGGGAGGAGRKRIAHTPGRSYTITVAAYGVQGAGGSNGSSGGTTSFDTICSATGGIGGTANGGGGAGGVAYGADVAFVGAIGADGIISSSGLSNGLYIGTGIGGASIYGGGGVAGSINNSTVSPTYGAGGGGAYLHNSLTGGNGGGGFVSIRELS